MRYVLLTIGTVLLGVCISWSTRFSWPEKTVTVAILSNGFAPLIPTPIQTHEAARYREYTQKVDRLLRNLEETTDNTSIIGEIAQDTPASGYTDAGLDLLPDPRAGDMLYAHASNVGEVQDNPNDRIVRIVLLGDSMIETLGKDLPHLRKKLEAAYDQKTFALYNYGQGATNLDQGCTRLTQETTYRHTIYPAILSLKPHIIILESFAYNHWSAAAHDLDRQWITLARCIDIIKRESPKTRIILAATIAPNIQTNGSALPNMSREHQIEWNRTTQAYLRNLLRFAASEKHPVADAYTPSLDQAGQGQLKYIDTTDRLHPSDVGKELFGQRIVEAIQQYNLIQ